MWRRPCISRAEGLAQAPQALWGQVWSVCPSHAGSSHPCPLAVSPDSSRHPPRKHIPHPSIRVQLARCALLCLFPRGRVTSPSSSVCAHAHGCTHTPRAARTCPSTHTCRGLHPCWQPGDCRGGSPSRLRSQREGGDGRDGALTAVSPPQGCPWALQTSSSASQRSCRKPTASRRSARRP